MSISTTSFYFILLQLHLLLIFNGVFAQTVIKSLPGFSGELPFTLETGYIGVGEMEEVQLFYYFIESESSPADDALLLWLTGGPGCSAFSGLVYEIGPLQFNYTNSSGNKPTLVLNPYAWTKVANIIFLDAPVGTGFSYAKSVQGYNVTDTISANQIYTFLQKWLMDHPNLLENQLYITGDSYSGIIVPLVVDQISQGNEIRRQPLMNLQGYVLGNPVTHQIKDINARIPFAHRMTLLSDSLYKSTKNNCKGEYMYPDPTNTACLQDLQLVTASIEKIFLGNILEPICSYLSPKPMLLKWDPSFIRDDSIDLLLSNPHLASKKWCRSYNYLYSYVWANDKSVRDALHVREGTIKEWTRCNKNLTYTSDVLTTIEIHKKLIKNGYRILIYSGDHDMSIPNLGTHEWIENLNLTISNEWKPWFLDGQIAGYTMEYYYKKSRLTYATVKGAGHTAPEYKPEQCLAMVERWFAYYPL